MGELATYALAVFTGFFAIMNPVANAPIFLGLVEGKNKETKRKIAKKSTITAFLIIALSVLLGKVIFEAFGITIPAFKITGGILILFVGFEMLMSQKSKVHSNDNDETNDSVAISPLAIPILAGPGTIVTAMNFVSDTDFVHIGIVIVIFALMAFLTYKAFTFSNVIVEKVGSDLIAVIGKLMGLIIAIIGTEMIIDGIKLSFNL